MKRCMLCEQIVGTRLRTHVEGPVKLPFHRSCWGRWWFEVVISDDGVTTRPPRIRWETGRA